MNLRNKSIILAGVFTILSFGVVAYLIGEKMAQTARKMSIDLALSKAQNSFLIVKNELDESIQRTRILAKSMEEIIEEDSRQESDLAKVLLTGLDMRKELYGCWFLYSDIPSSQKDKVRSLCYRKEDNSIVEDSIGAIHLDFLKKMKNQGGEMISDPYWDRRGNLLATVLVPVLRKGKIVGVIGSDLDLYSFQQRFYDNKALGRAYVTMISQQGYCIIHPDEKQIGNRMDTMEDGELVRKVLASGEKFQEQVRSEFLQVPVMRVYQPFRVGSSEKFWLITVSVPLFNVSESVQEIRNSTALIGLVLALLLMVFLYYSQRKWQYEFSQRQRAEVEHRNVVNKLSSIMESTDQIMIFAVGCDYKYTSFNSVYQRDMKEKEGVSVGVGSDLLDAYDGDFRIQMKKYLDRALNGDHFLVEYQRHGIHYQQIFNAIPDEDGKVVEVSSFRFDISETVELRRRTREQEEENVKAQLKNIKNQINPHFLFNSLNSLYALVEEEPVLARQFIVKLSKVYRYLLDSNNSNLIFLRQEMEFIKHYLFLQKIRFGENLILENEIPDEYLSRKLPSVSLQSLIENAIKHNVVTTTEPLTIRLRMEGESILLVENPYQPRQDLGQTPGTGLRNLEALYRFISDKQPVYGLEEGSFRVRLPLL